MADGSVIIEIKGEADELKQELEGAGNTAKSVFSGLAKAAAGLFAVNLVKDLGVAVYRVGSEFETAFAQVETIMDASQMSVEDMERAIRSLSKETGVAAADLSGTVYSAISATGDTANAVKLTADATKLAAAGFTDTDSALSVLTTTMNAYHLSADQAQAISDSLITTQNRGVTTVAELAAGMGKAIAMGSAFGVDLHNLEAAYISTTKAGIGTAESTTYISSMIKELGDNGSQVAKTLQQETGQSFSQLMESGMSLGDVLGILLESVDGSTDALQNLWSSAEAGLASSAIVGQGLDYFGESLDALADSAGATQTAYETMADTLQHKTDLIKTQAQDMAVSLFEAAGPALSGLADLALAGLEQLAAIGVRAKEFITPMVEGIKDGVQRIKDAIDNIFTPEQQAAIGEFLRTLGALLVSVPFAVVAAAVEILANAFELLADTVNAVAGFFTGTLPGAVDSASAALERAGGAVQAVIDWFAQLPGRIAGFLSGALAAVMGWASNLLSQARQAGSNVLSGIQSALSALPGIVTGLLAGALAALIAWGGQMASQARAKMTETANAIKSGLTALPGQMRSIGSNIVQGLIGGLASKLSALKAKAAEIASTVKNAVTGLLGIHSPSRVMHQYGVYVVQGFVDGIRSQLKTVERITERLADGVVKQIEDLNDQIKKIEAAAAERQERKEFEDYQKKLREKQEAVDKAKAADRQKALEALQELHDDWNEKQLKRQEEAQKKELQSQITALEKRQKALEDFRKEHEDALEEIQKKQESLAARLAGGDLLTREKNRKGDTVSALASLSDQTRKIEQYGALLDMLKGRGASQSLLDEVLSMDMDEAMEYMRLLKGRLRDNDEAWAAYLRSWDEKEEAAARIAARFYSEQVEAVGQEYDARLREEFSDLMETGYDAGQNVVKGLINGMKSQEKALRKTAAVVGNTVKTALQAALKTHSPSRVTEEIGQMSGRGLALGLEESTAAAFRRFRQEVEAEVQRVGAGLAARAENAGRVPAVTREIERTTHTVDRVAWLEGDGLTGEFIRMLNLRLKEDDRRLGLA